MKKEQLEVLSKQLLSDSKVKTLLPLFFNEVEIQLKVASGEPSTTYISVDFRINEKINTKTKELLNVISNIDKNFSFYENIITIDLLKKYKEDSIELIKTILNKIYYLLDGIETILLNID